LFRIKVLNECLEKLNKPTIMVSGHFTIVLLNQKIVLLLSKADLLNPQLAGNMLPTTQSFEFIWNDKTTFNTFAVKTEIKLCRSLVNYELFIMKTHITLLYRFVKYAKMAIYK
jgi:hypothetical protein